jgi:hypothetical protein
MAELFGCTVSRGLAATRLDFEGKRNNLAEGTGLEPAYPFGRRFSRPLHYHYATPPTVADGTIT